MSLVVARAFTDQIYILADTALTLSDEFNRSPYTKGCLKQYFINDKLVIAFAGDKQDFESALPNFLQCNEVLEVQEIALETQKMGGDFELLIAELGASYITFIKRESAYKAAAGFLGDSDAHNAYQVFYHDASRLESDPIHKEIANLAPDDEYFESMQTQPVRNQMRAAFKEVIESNKFPTVGGLVIPLGGRKDKFQFQIYMETYNATPIKCDAGVETILPLIGQVADGSFTVEFFDNITYGGDGRTIGAYFPQGQFGIVFAPERNGFCSAKVIRAENPAIWVLNTRNEIGIGISSFFLNVSNCVQAGEWLQSQSRFDDALFVYSLCRISKELELDQTTRDMYFSSLSSAMFNSGDTGGAIFLLRTQLKQIESLTKCRAMLGRMVYQKYRLY